MICGFRTDEGIIKSLQHFNISDIPKETQVLNQCLVYTTRVDKIYLLIKCVVKVYLELN